MKNKGFFKIAVALLAALVLLGGFSVTAYAGGGEDMPTNDSGVIVETEPQPLTPDGNLSLIDDIEGEAAEDKQFIIVQSKNGNYFYIIVDRAAEGENTVHFLNQVDEADLVALMEGDSGKAQAPAVCTCKDKCKAGAVNTACPVCSVNMTECAGKEAVPEPDDAPPEKEKSNAGGLVIFLVVTLLAGGGAFYYFKIMKPKQGIKGDTDLDDFDFDDYGEDERKQVARNRRTRNEVSHCREAECGGGTCRRPWRKKQKGRIYGGRLLPHFMVRGAFGGACGSRRLWGAVQKVEL